MSNEFSRPHQRKQFANGNAIVEYIMPVSIILVLSIGAITAIGAALDGQFNALKGDMKNKVSSAQQQNQLHQLQASAFQAAAASSNKSGGSNGSSSGAGSYSTAGLSAADISKVIQTAGANGGTETLATALTKYIDQLKAAGNLTPDQINTLTQLANAGHDMANAEKALKDAVDGGQSSVTYNGKSYSVADFTAQFGFIGSIGINAANTMDPTNAMPQLAPFMNLYAQAKANGSLTDPAVSDQVTYLSKQIAALSDLAKYNTTTSPTDLSYGYTTAMQQLALQNPPASISDATHGNSAGICQSGGSGKDSGTNCN